MHLSKSPYLWLSIAVTCCALALGLIPSLMPDAVLGEDNTLYETPMPVASTAPQAIITVPEIKFNEYADGFASSDLPYGRDVYKVVKQMPLFPGKDCGDIFDYHKRAACSTRAMLKYIYANIKYPKKARERGTQGMAVVTFIVEPHGAITNIKIVRDPGDGLGKAVAKVVKKMRKDVLRWEPGLHRGKPVPVQMALPVKFKLE